MSNVVETIYDSMLDQAKNQLGSQYQKLQHVSELEKLSNKTARLGYGIRVLGASSAETMTRTYTLDQDFELILTDTVARKDTEDQSIESVLLLFKRAHEMINLYMRTKINLPSTVLIVFDPVILEPEYINANEIVALRVRLKVKYRQSLN